MKANPQIDELLCSFIDGELSLRQQTEVQRLVARDAEVAKRLRQLQNCKNLVNSLPAEQAPGDMLEQIKRSWERQSLLGERPVSAGTRAGAWHLKVRRFVAAAAMIALMGGLGAVVYQIVAPVPAGVPGPVAIDAPQPSPVVPEPLPPVAAPMVASGPGFSGRLELRTAALTQADAFLKAAIEDNGLKGLTQVQTLPDRRIYRIECSREGLDRLVADLGTIWQNFESATLTVDTDRFAEPVVLESVTPHQTAQIIGQDSAEACVEAARRAAVLNGFAQAMPGREILSPVENDQIMTIAMPEIPRPRLASNDPATKAIEAPPQGGVQTSLTIVLLNTQ
ncbi:MAG TPA: hypothetical protein PLU87_18265 [Sedimentisphaerales bacterium]|nr:hypothetical protein [Sedimentisphaerales bacterium]HRS13007.1 hypothetical protein [Sedimentisphaerales bacterium]HRV49571.1 hypothetical protein [Sedimentisphaerales bacterium]